MGKTDNQRKTWKLFLEPNTEYLWMNEAEWRALVPGKARKGLNVPVPPVLAQRLARFHFTPRRAITSEGGILNPRDVKTANLDLQVTEVTNQRIIMRLTGHIHTGTTFDAAKATSPDGPLGFGFESPILGTLEYDRTTDRFTRFDVVALGHLWGRWGDANGKSLFAERPGRTPFAFALELATNERPTDRIPPGGNGAYITERSGYFNPLK